MRHGCGVKRLLVSLCVTFLTRNNLMVKLAILSGLALAISFCSASLDIEGGDPEL